MTVAALIEKLKKFPPDTIVVARGHDGFMPVATVEYLPTWYVDSDKVLLDVY